MEKLVSIIVPVFNSEKSIHACLQSLLEQDYPNVEIIVIDDGSTDRSREIISKCAEKNSNIVIIEQDNQGVSVARNVGISHARGEYICFVDSDDVVTSDYCSSMIMYMGEADIVIGGRTSFSDGEYIKTKCAPSVFSEKGSDSIKWLLLGKYNAHMVCTKMFRKAMLLDNRIQFPCGMIFEDLCFSVDAFLAAKTVTYVDRVVYHYLVHSNSAHTTVSEKYIIDYTKALWYTCKQIEDNNLVYKFLSEIIIKLEKGLDRICRTYVNSNSITAECFKDNVKLLLEMIQRYRKMKHD